MIKLAVIDDHHLVRNGIVSLLASEQQLSVIAEGASGEEAIEIARNLEPDVMLMDIKMPGIGGLEATRKICQSRPYIKILALSSCSDDVFPSKLLQAGASGYMTKGAKIDEIIKAVKTVQQGQKYISPDIAQKLVLQSLGGQLSEKNPFNELSDREMQVALMVTSGQSVQEISDQLCLSPKTINTYRYRIFDKLNIGAASSGDVQLTRLAAKYGVLDSEEML